MCQVSQTAKSQDHVERPESPYSVNSAAQLFSLQLWCWGRDIEYAQGNLLVQFGFQRLPKPAGSDSSSIYRLELSPRARIVLRGFGVFCGDDHWGGIFVRRFGFRPKFTPTSEVRDFLWSVNDLPPLVAPQPDQVQVCEHLLSTLIDMTRQYEAWIAATIGSDYREQTLRPWCLKHDAVVPAGNMGDTWKGLAVAISNHPERFILSNT